MDFDERWLSAGGVVPVDIPTTAALVHEVQRLRGILSGEAGFLRAAAEDGGLTVGLEHPLVAVMADSLAKMVDGHNYVEMRMTHKQTMDEYTVHVQRTTKPTPHELRKRAEKKIEDHNAECEKLCDNRKRCGYEGYRSYMSCPDCPKNWIIE